MGPFLVNNNVFRTAFQPLCGQLANVFGRRWPVIISTAIFVLGSGVCGGAKNMDMLIAGRAIQGLGSGGINVLVEIIICDIVPLRERGNYLALIFGSLSIGTALGPFFGGLIVQRASWRWVFYLCLPVGFLALILLAVFLKVKYKKDDKLAARLGAIDWTGTAIFVASVVSVLLSLSWAGSAYPWSSFRVIVPLVLGMVGFGVFLIFEASKFCQEPTMPIHLFANRTSCVGFILAFIHMLINIWATYFLPVYFQGVLGSSPEYSGVQLLPTTLFMFVAVGMGGPLVARWGRYRPINHIGFALMTLGFGLFTRFDAETSTAEWVIFQAIEVIGGGLVVPALLPSVQAELTDADIALATSTFAFMRSFSCIWGVVIPSTVFNNRFDQLAGRISDPAIARQLNGGKAYEHATQKFLDTLTSQVRSEVISVFSDSLRLTWQLALGFSALGFALVILQKEVKLRRVLDTEFGMEDEQAGKAQNEVDEKASRALQENAG